MVNFIPLILLLGIFSLIMAVLYLFRKYHQARKRRPPFTQHFLRSPGESVRRKIEEISEEGIICLFVLFVTPLLAYAVFMPSLYFSVSKPPFPTASFALIFILVYETYLLVKLIKFLNLRRSYRLGYEGEVAVAQELNQLMLEGYRVYHDFPADKFNIDHIVIGSSGVFAVETKARSKPTTTNRTADAKVIYDGKRIQFPDWTDVESIEQAKRQAKWLSKWLASAVGDPVSVRPVVTLPGWFVERVSGEGIPVINPRQFRSIAKPQKGTVFSESMISRIAHQIEQKCRNKENGVTS